MSQFAVIGLGRFGSTASKELIKMGHSVLGIDIDQKVVDKLADEITQAVIVDVSDKSALKELGLENYDTILVAIGSNFQASLLCVVHLKSLGLENIWVKATSNDEHLILNKLGITRIIHPEEEMGVKVAQALSYPMVNDYISLGNGKFIVEIEVNETLEDTSIKNAIEGEEKNIHILVVKRKINVHVHPDGDFLLKAKDVLVLLGDLNQLKSIAPKLM